MDTSPEFYPAAFPRFTKVYYLADSAPQKVVKSAFARLFSRAIVRFLPSTFFDTFVVDFEAGIWQDPRDVFDDPKIKGCAFHYSQALCWMVQDVRLQTAYNSRGDEYSQQRKTFLDQLETNVLSN